jgi:guanylate kinase
MPSSYTGAEKRRIAWLGLKALKQSTAGDRHVDTIDSKLKAEMDRIEQRAEDRGQREVQALQQRLSAARNAAASAKATMRTSSGKDRATARTEMQQHEQAARRIERELRRYQ